jgi:hypothetical protein
VLVLEGDVEVEVEGELEVVLDPLELLEPVDELEGDGRGKGEVDVVVVLEVLEAGAHEYESSVVPAGAAGVVPGGTSTVSVSG